MFLGTNTALSSGWVGMKLGCHEQPTFFLYCDSLSTGDLSTAGCICGLLCSPSVSGSLPPSSPPSQQAIVPLLGTASRVASCSSKLSLYFLSSMRLSFLKCSKFSLHWLEELSYRMSFSFTQVDYKTLKAALCPVSLYILHLLSISLRLQVSHRPEIWDPILPWLSWGRTDRWLGETGFRKTLVSPSAYPGTTFVVFKWI